MSTRKILTGSDDFFKPMARLTRSGRKKLEDALLKKGLQVERYAKQFCPVDTGRLRSSITTKLEYRGSTPIVRIGTNVEYAPFIEFGSEPYIIEPDEAEALHWQDAAGEDVFAKKVEHPGIPSQPFLIPALDKVRNENR